MGIFHSHSVFIAHFLWLTPISIRSESGGESRCLCGFRETALRMEPPRARASAAPPAGILEEHRYAS